MRVHGVHAKRYLQARLTQNINNLNIGDSTESAILSPQGQIEGLLQICCNSKDEYLLFFEGDAEDWGSVESALKRFKVSEIVEFERLANQQAFICSQAIHADHNGAYCRFSMGDKELYLYSDSSVSEHFGNFQNLTHAEYTLARILEGRPLFPNDIPKGTLLLELPAVGRIYSDHKGCYAGQEVVEKIAARGKVPFVLRPFQSETLQTENQAVMAEEGKVVGHLSSVYRDADGCFGFLRIKNITISNTLFTESGTVELLKNTAA